MKVWRGVPVIYRIMQEQTPPEAWLQENIPTLYLRYTTVMQYKQVAKKLRQVAGFTVPIPAVRMVVAEPPASERVEVLYARAVYR